MLSYTGWHSWLKRVKKRLGLHVEALSIPCPNNNVQIVRKPRRAAGTENLPRRTRTDYRQHDIQMVGSDDKGNMDFIVYGYMNRGSHEGEVGLVFYRYHSEENALEEVFYLPYEKPYSIMKEELGTLSYISDTGLLYLMLNNSIYAIDFVGNECLVVVDYVNEESLVISDDRSVIAWQEGEKPYAASSVQVMYLDSGKKQTVTAGEGEYLKALGFCGDDFICGYA